MAIEIQVHSRNFKSKGDNPGPGYSFRLVRVYKLEDAQLPPISTPEKRRRGSNEWIATLPRTKKTNAALNSLGWILDESSSGDSNTT